MNNDDLDRTITALRPVAVDRLAGAAYERRRDPLLVRADGEDVRTARLTPARPRRRLAVVAGAAVAAAALVVASSSLPGKDRSGEATGNGPKPYHGTLDARTFLLASAETAAKQPATRGTCWYSRTRMWLDVERGDPAGAKPQPSHLPRSIKPYTGPVYRAQTASTMEDWKCVQPGTATMRFRTRWPLDVRVTFPSKKDEAAWRAAGSPALEINGGTTRTKPSTVTYEKGSHLVNPDIGSHEIEWRTIPRLPATKSGLETYLRRLWKEDRSHGAHGYTAPADFGEYVFVSAWDLFMAPTTPGTRAALYQVLADSPSVHITGRVTDREGRPGVVIATDRADVRLTVDPRTAELLDYQEVQPARPGGPADGGGMYRSFEHQGWVDKIGARPGS
ncbi:hypothetical protein [Actinoallomurus soli]|uniref:hypothetical protein n=1 Tax=Actinoallomurus soli TaxID=2952535 RepID=UPI00209235E7|nr:hypothetical protein [Actinoallomurus soli]MCO5972943.1 hypothetical protein [Actinoallomurus soli]